MAVAPTPLWGDVGSGSQRRPLLRGATRGRHSRQRDAVYTGGAVPMSDVHMIRVWMRLVRLIPSTVRNDATTFQAIGTK